ncbi:MAG TPA: copper chaperone PCu(A)C [Acidimicrobiales bacterium]|nr:copper chaperone PCu(A)C [Acidimicrobiales bacterium]
MSPRTRLPRSALVALALLIPAWGGLVGCSDGSGSGTASATSQVLTVVDARLDEPANPSLGAVRLVIDNPTSAADRLVGVSSPDADSTTLHRSGTDAEGRATMAPVTDLPLPAGSRVTFGETGLHVMLNGLHREVRAGDTVTLNLEFQRAGTITVEVAVVEPGSDTSAAADPGHPADHGDQGDHVHGHGTGS